MRFRLPFPALALSALLAAPVPSAAAPPGPSVPVGPDNSIAIRNAAVPAGWLALGRAVARVDTPRECGSGFLIGDDCFLTNAHVVSGQAAADIKLWFGYEDTTAPFDNHRGCAVAADGACAAPDVWTVTSVTILSPATALDCALIKVAPKAGRTPGQVYGKLAVSFREPVLDEKVAVIGHPDGGCKEWSSDGDAKVVAVNDAACGPAGWFSHAADTQSGSSGSPVFASDGCVIGMHAAGIASVPKNCAVKMSAVKALVEAQGCTFVVCDQPVPAAPTSWGRMKAGYR